MLLNLIIAFGAGLISFLSPCVLPLIPGYISYISGESLGDIVEKQKKFYLKRFYFHLDFHWFLFLLVLPLHLLETCYWNIQIL